MLRLYRAFITLLYPAAVLVAIVPVLLWPRGRKALAERMALRCPRAAAGSPRFWIHAASVGEVKTSMPLIRGLRRHFPGSSLLISTATPAGWEVAHADFGGDQTLPVCMLPVDVPWVARRALKAFGPDYVWVIETEYWPGFFSEAKRLGARLWIVNGRIGDKGWRRIRRAPWGLAETVSLVDRFFMRSDHDAARLVALWPALRGRVQVAGNIKSDALALQAIRTDWPPALQEALGQGRWLFLASTHPGEEAMLLPPIRNLLERYPDLRLLVAPREPSRFGEVASLLDRGGIAHRRRSQIGSPLGTFRTVLLDSVGELFSLMAWATVVFVGGSLVPRGGHNVLEPAGFGCPVLFGPYMENFLEERDLMIESGGGVRIDGACAFESAVQRWLDDPKAAQSAGERGREAVRSREGAVDRILNALEIENADGSF